MTCFKPDRKRTWCYFIHKEKKLLSKLMTLDTDFNVSIWCWIHLDSNNQMLLVCLYGSQIAQLQIQSN